MNIYLGAEFTRVVLPVPGSVDRSDENDDDDDKTETDTPRPLQRSIYNRDELLEKWAALRPGANIIKLFSAVNYDWAK